MRGRLEQRRLKSETKLGSGKSQRREPSWRGIDGVWKSVESAQIIMTRMDASSLASPSALPLPLLHGPCWLVHCSLWCSGGGGIGGWWFWANSACPVFTPPPSPSPLPLPPPGAIRSRAILTSPHRKRAGVTGVNVQSGSWLAGSTGETKRKEQDGYGLNGVHGGDNPSPP